MFISFKFTVNLTHVNSIRKLLKEFMQCVSGKILQIMKSFLSAISLFLVCFVF